MMFFRSCFARDVSQKSSPVSAAPFGRCLFSPRFPATRSAEPCRLTTLRRRSPPRTCRSIATTVLRLGPTSNSGRGQAAMIRGHRAHTRAHTRARTRARIRAPIRARGAALGMSPVDPIVGPRRMNGVVPTEASSGARGAMVVRAKASGGARGVTEAAGVVRQLAEAPVGVCAGSCQATPSRSHLLEKLGRQDTSAQMDAPVAPVPVSTSQKGRVEPTLIGIGSHRQATGGTTALAIGVHSRSRGWASTRMQIARPGRT